MQGEEIERLRQDYKERSERRALTTCHACTVPMNTRSLTATGRRHNEGVVRWENILRNLASRNAGRVAWRSLLDYYDVISVLAIRAKLAFCLSRS